EGKPVSGVRVTALQIEEFSSQKGTVDFPEVRLPHPEIAIEATTGADGGCRLTGLGSGRLVKLRMEEPTLTTEEVRVLTRVGVRSRDKEGILYAAEFRHPLAPSWPIEGVVRDRETGKPVPGIEVE